MSTCKRQGRLSIAGAANKLRLLTDRSKLAGVVTASTGNHGHAIAFAGKALGVPVTVWANESTSHVKLSAMRHYGADLRLTRGTAVEIELIARADAERIGKTFVSPYNDSAVIAGQGTIGVELLAQTSHIDAVFLSVGGGGLASGIGIAIKTKHPHIDIVGCWPAAAASMMRSLEAGHIMNPLESKTISDGTAGGLEPDSMTFPICQQVIDRLVSVAEHEIYGALREAASNERWILEGAAGVSLAAAKKAASEYAGKTIVIVLCGRNIALEEFLSAINESEEIKPATEYLDRPQ